MSIFPDINTTLDLNGPELSFTTQPVGVATSVASGIATFIGIGLSYGFLEPLESTGLFTTHENILRLIDTFQRRDGHIHRD